MFRPNSSEDSFDRQAFGVESLRRSERMTQLWEFGPRAECEACISDTIAWLRGQHFLAPPDIKQQIDVTIEVLMRYQSIAATRRWPTGAAHVQPAPESGEMLIPRVLAERAKQVKNQTLFLQNSIAEAIKFCQAMTAGLDIPESATTWDQLFALLWNALFEAKLNGHRALMNYASGLLLQWARTTALHQPDKREYVIENVESLIRAIFAAEALN